MVTVTEEIFNEYFVFMKIQSIGEVLSWHFLFKVSSENTTSNMSNLFRVNNEGTRTTVVTSH